MGCISRVRDFKRNRCLAIFGLDNLGWLEQNGVSIGRQPFYDDWFVVFFLYNRCIADNITEKCV
jgi:hypothetical protein